MMSVLLRLLFRSYFTLIVYCKGALTTTMSKNPVYTGEPVTLFCKLEANDVAYIDEMGVARLLTVTMEAENNTQIVGTLICTLSTGNSAGTGHFSGLRFTGCEAVSLRNPRLGLSVVASTSWELTYRCLFKVFWPNTHSVLSTSDVGTRLSVFVKPETPWFIPSVMVFNDSRSVTLICNSRFGKPAADIDFAVLQSNGPRYERRHGTNSITLKLSGPLGTWHGASATCTVTNHLFSDATARTIHVNYIAALRDGPVQLDTCSSSLMLNCSAEISSVPAASYKWSIPADANILEFSSSLSSPVFTVPQWRSGLFHCTGTNKATLNTVSVTFAVVSCETVTTTASNWTWTVIVAVCAAILIMVVALALLWKRGPSSKVTKLPLLSAYASRQDYEDNGNKDRLLVAAEGVVANLGSKVLPAVTLVELADHSCSLDGILAKIEKELQMHCTSEYASVALLMQRSRGGLILSEVDQVVLNSENWTGTLGGKQHDFFARLIAKCLNRRACYNRIDLLNYGGEDATNLAMSMSSLLKVVVTVSKDRFGLDESNRQLKEHSCVGDDYFNRASLSGIVYTEVDGTHGQSSIRQSTEENDDA